jgi:multiple sugar transport system ATP-binding protein
VATDGSGVPAEVMLAEHLGDSSILHLSVEGVGELLNAKMGAGDTPLEAGQRVGLRVEPRWTLGFDAAGRLLP